MSVAEDKVPPVPSLIPPIASGQAQDTELGMRYWRFNVAWMQWFEQIKIKVDVINSDLYQLANILGTGLPSKDPSGNWTTREVAQGTGIIVTDGDGVGGNPTVAIDVTWTGYMSISGVGTLTIGVWNATVIDNTYLDAAPKMTVTSTSAVGGGASALPANPVGYVEVQVGGVTKKIPYYD